MKMLLLSAVMLMFVSDAALDAQSIAGTWQGTLPIEKNPRVALKITKAEDGSLHGVYYAVDMGDGGVPLSSVTFAAPNLEVKFLYADLSYRAKLNADGKSFDGIWTREKQSYPLTLVLATEGTLWRSNAVAATAPMAATADPSFEVATIKPSAGPVKGPNFALHTRRFTAGNRTVEDLVKFAYNVRDRQVEGGPSWLHESRFDIAAEPDTEGVPSDDQDRLMLKKLLADRFKLSVHAVKKTFSVYALTVEKNPPAIVPSDPETNNSSSVYVKSAPNEQMSIQIVGRTMPMFVDMLMDFIPDRQILDETGLKGKFEITLTLPEIVMQSGESVEDKANAFIHAVQALGLGLVPKREELDVIVIDTLEKPSAN